MYKAMTIKQAMYLKDMDAFLPLFEDSEIKARREERRRRDREWKAAAARQAARAQAKRDAMTKEAWKAREQELNDRHQRESADLAASVAGGFTMAAGLLALAMIF